MEGNYSSIITRLLMIVRYKDFDIPCYSLLSVDVIDIDVRSFISLGSIETLSQVPLSPREPKGV